MVAVRTARQSLTEITALKVYLLSTDQKQWLEIEPKNWDGTETSEIDLDETALLDCCINGDCRRRCPAKCRMQTWGENLPATGRQPYRLVRIVAVSLEGYHTILGQDFNQLIAAVQSTVLSPVFRHPRMFLLLHLCWCYITFFLFRTINIVQSTKYSTVQYSTVYVQYSTDPKSLNLKIKT